MRRSFAALAALAALAATTGTPRPAYPPAPRGDVVETLHGVAVADPYRGLEELGDPRVVAWARAQDELTRAWTDASPAFAAVAGRQDAIARMTLFGPPQVEGGRLFFVRRGAEGRDPVLLSGATPETARVLVDPRAAGPGLTLGLVRAAPGGRHVVYGVGPAAGRGRVLRVREVASGRDVDGDVGATWGGCAGVAWLADGSGFYYTHAADAPGAAPGSGPCEVRLHRLGAPAAADVVVHAPDDPEWLFLPAVARDGSTLVLVGWRRNENRVLWAALGDPARPALREVPAQGAMSFVGVHGGRLLLLTDVGAERGRVVAVDPARPAPGAWQDVVAQGPATLSAATLLGDRLVLVALEDARPVLRVVDLDGGATRRVELPGVGWVGGVTGPDGDEPGAGDVAWFSQSGVADPGTVYRLDLATGATSVFLRGDLPFDPGAFVTEQVFYESADGTRVSMFLARRRDLPLGTTPRPVWLYGYGSFAWPAVPWFQPPIVSWLEMGGVYALANVRGGGEHGRAWYEAGVGARKQTSIDDYLAAAEHLIATGVTRRELLVANGGSASGPLAAAAVVQRPELFAAAVVDIPVLDMLRFPRAPGGARWTPEFGDPADPLAFRALHAYSPLHRLRPGVCYPATLVTAGEKDESAPPWHAYKWTAALQEAQGCARPVLLQVAWGAGHTFGADDTSARETHARRLAFLWRALGLDET